MNLAALALSFLASCSASAAPPGDPHVAYTVAFGPKMAEKLLPLVVATYKERLGSDASIRTDVKAGTVRVEFPVSKAFLEAKPERKLAAELRAGETSSSCSIEPPLPRGELAEVDGEWLRLEGTNAERGLFGSAVVAHAAGAKVRLFSDGRVRMLLTSTGQFEFLQEATDEFLAANQTTRAAERARFDTWRTKNPAERLLEFDRLEREQGGPLPDTLWRRVRSTGDYALLLRSAEPRFRFSLHDIESVGYSQDQMGYPAVSFELKKERAKDFGDWTASILRKHMAIVLDDEILTLATVLSRLPGGGIIEGGARGFSKEEVQLLMESLKPPGLPPLLVSALSVEVEFIR
jgi:hypothetical protein